MGLELEQRRDGFERGRARSRSAALGLGAPRSFAARDSTAAAAFAFVPQVCEIFLRNRTYERTYNVQLASRCNKRVHYRAGSVRRARRARGGGRRRRSPARAGRWRARAARSPCRRPGGSTSAAASCILAATTRGPVCDAGERGPVL